MSLIRGKKSLSQTSSRQSITDWISQRKCFLLLQVSSLSTDMTFLTLMNEHERKFDQLIFLFSSFWFVPFSSICLYVVSSSVLVQFLRFSSFSLLPFCSSFAEFQFQTQTQFQFFFWYFTKRLWDGLLVSKLTIKRFAQQRWFIDSRVKRLTTIICQLKKKYCPGIKEKKVLNFVTINEHYNYCILF